LNLILRKRIITLIAMSYAIKEEHLWRAYEKLGNLEKIVTMLENNQLQDILQDYR